MEFTAETDLPLRLAILVDTSNSVRDRFRFIQEAAIEFINSVIRPRQDRALVVSFDAAPELVSDLDDNTEKLTGRIRDLRPGAAPRLRRHLLRLPGQAGGGAAAAQVSAGP